MSIEEFLAERRTAQDEAIAQTEPAVEAALALRDEGEPTWTEEILAAATLIYLATYAAELPDAPNPQTQLDQFTDAISATLNLTTDTEPGSQDRADQVERLSLWLGVAAINAATYASLTFGDRDAVGAEWRTMRDESVRSEHRPLDGQQRRFGQTFDVAGAELRYPGEPVGPPSAWINCRCVLRPVRLDQEANVVAALTAAVDADYKGGMVAVKPANPEDVAVDGGDAPEDMHVTMVFLGDDVSGWSQAQRDSINTAAQTVAKTLPITAAVAGVGRLGSADPPAAVLFLNLDKAEVVYMQDEMRALVEGILNGEPQHRPWIPHLTLGYGLNPNDYQDMVGREIVLDRVDVHLGGDVSTYQAEEAIVQDEEDLEAIPEAPTEEVPWHGVLAPEGVRSGDRRRFEVDSLRWRELPLPLLWQRANSDGHGGAVVVGRIDRIWRDDGLIKAEGVFADNAAAEEVIPQLAEGFIRGVSVDVDDHEMEISDDLEISIPSGRIAAATLVSIPAFQEAFVRLGTWAEANVEDCDECDHDSDAGEQAAFSAALDEYAITDQPWDGSSGRFTPEQWRHSTVLHREPADGQDPLTKSLYSLPILEPNGDLNRNAVHAAAARINQVTDATSEEITAAKRRLRSAYRRLDEDAPESVTASVTFRRGPGWVTHPEETRRLHTYWTSGPGAAKIRWGTEGSFRRCRRELAKYLPPQYLNRTCAEWYHDATGRWPGRKRGDLANSATVSAFTVGEVTVAAANVTKPPFEFFTNPNLDQPTAPILTECGRYYGHLALWDTCHLDYRGVCLTPPHSIADYAYFATGVIDTTDGSVPVGQITFDAEHAGERLTPELARAHYANTAKVAADVTVGEDEHGIWFSGVVRGSLDDDTVQRLLRHGLSGDWRTIRGNLELVAALAVNVPAFPVPRAKASFAGETQLSLVGAGLVMAHSATPAPEPIGDIAQQVIEYVDRKARAIESKQKMRAVTAAGLRRKMN